MQLALRSGISAKLAAAAAAIILLALAFGGYYFLQSPSPIPSSSTSSSTGQTSMEGSNYTISTAAAATNSSSGQLGPWNPTTPYPDTSPASCVTATEFIYCVGGNDSATFYAPISASGIGTWVRTTDYPIPIEAEQCLADSGYIYCVGGESSSQTTDPFGRTADVFYAILSSSGIGAWKATTPFPHVEPYPRCMTFGSSIYCVSGLFNGTGFLSSAQTFIAPLSQSGVGSWKETTGPVNMTAGCSGVGSYAYCFGGAECQNVFIGGDCPSPTYFSHLSSSGLGGWNETSELPTAGFASYVTAESYIYYLTVPVYFAQVSATGVGPWQITTNFPEGGSAGACASSGAYIYCADVTNASFYYAQAGAPNPGAIKLLNPPPFQSVQYLIPAWSGSGGGCSTTSNGKFAGGPCFGDDIDDAVVFSCVFAAELPSGCETTVVSPANATYDYNVTVWYPDSNVTSADANCEYLPSLGFSAPQQGWCASISQDSFIIAEQSP
jgi:hypothetical protein